jgi:phosphohistidine phosphatase
MPTLVLLRHAKSGYPPGVDDHERPLAPRGEREAPIAGREIARLLSQVSGRPPEIDLVLVSTATRAQQTWQLAAEALPAVGRRHTDPDLYLASVSQLWDIVHGLPQEARCAVLVGHNDGLEELARQLSGQPVRLKTSSFAVLSSEHRWDQWSVGRTQLHAVVVAR